MFHPNSFWRRPIGPNPTVDPNSAVLISSIAGLSVTIIGVSDNGSTPVHKITSTVPTYTVTFTTGSIHTVGVPIPSGVIDEPGSDAKMVFLDTLAQRGYSYYRFNVTPTPKQCETGGWGDIGDTGDGFSTRRDYPPPGGSDGWGGRAAGWPYFAGLIGKDEMADRNVQHALAVSIKAEILHDTNYNWPALATDGLSTTASAMVMGMRLQLDPTIDVTTLGLSIAGQALAKTLQTYGAWVSDRNSQNIQFYCEEFVGGTEPDQYVDSGPWTNILTNSDLAALPVGSMRVVQVTQADFYPIASQAAPPASPPTIVGSNILSNPGFEASFEYFTNWQASFYIVGSAHTGSQCCRADMTNTPYSIGTIDNIGIATIGEKLYGGAWVRGLQGGQVRLAIRESGLWQIEEFGAWATLSTAWQRVAAEHIQAQGWPVDMYVVSNTASQFFVDDLYLATVAESVASSDPSGSQPELTTWPRQEKKDVGIVKYLPGDAIPDNLKRVAVIEAGVDADDQVVLDVNYYNAPNLVPPNVQAVAGIVYTPGSTGVPANLKKARKKL